MKFWNVIQLFEDKYSVPYLKEQGLDDEFIGCVCTFMSPDAKMLSN